MKNTNEWEKEIDELVRDLCSVVVKPKSEVRRRINELVEKAYNKGKQEGKQEYFLEFAVTPTHKAILENQAENLIKNKERVAYKNGYCDGFEKAKKEERERILEIIKILKMETEENSIWKEQGELLNKYILPHIKEFLVAKINKE